MADETLGRALKDQVEIAWRLARDRLDGLSDEEFFWEPVGGCWSLRPKDHLVTGPPNEEVPGDWWFDGSGVEAPEPPPFTTIAWLVAHMILGTWNWNHIIAGRAVAPEPALPAHAAQAVSLWREVTDTFEAIVGSFSDEALTTAVPAWGGQVLRSFLISHVTCEVLHHSAEVGRLRDLYRNRDSLSR
jgi:hypothetical protein